MVVFKRAVIPSIHSLSGCILPWPSSTIQDAFWAVHVFAWCTWLHWSCRRKRSFCCTISLKNTPGCSTTLSAGGVGILPCVEPCVCTKPEGVAHIRACIKLGCALHVTLQISLSIFCCLYQLFGTGFVAAATLNFLHLHSCTCTCTLSDVLLLSNGLLGNHDRNVGLKLLLAILHCCFESLFMIYVRYSTQV